MILLEYQVWRGLGYHKTGGTTTKLQSLDLSKNNLIVLPVGIFRDQAKCLKDLYLQSNHIAQIMSSTFSNLHSLNILNLNDTANLTTHQQAFHQVTTDSLRISYGKSCSFQNRSFYGLHFRADNPAFNLRIQHAELSILPNLTFSGVCDLAQLDLSWNKITTICRLAFIDLISLTVLNLEHNHLISPFENIHELVLNNNHLVGINGMSPLRFVNSLKNLHLNKNCISTMFNLFAERRTPWPIISHEIKGSWSSFEGGAEMIFHYSHISIHFVASGGHDASQDSVWWIIEKW